MQTSKNELVRIVEHYMRICEKQAQGRATYSLKCLTTYEGNPAAEVYSTPIGKKPTEDGVELWGIDVEQGTDGIIYEK